MNARSRKLLGALAALALAVAGAWMWRQHRREREARERAAAAAQHWADARRCLVGEPLGAGESLAARVRRIRLAQPGDDWPAGCAAHLEGLHRSASPPMAAELEARFGCAPDCRIEDPAAQLSGLAEHLRDLQEVSSTVAAPPRVDPPRFGAGELKVWAPAPHRILDRLVRPDGAVHLLLSTPRAAVQICTLPANGGALSCRTNPGILPADAAFSGQEAIVVGQAADGGGRRALDVEGKEVTLYAGVHDGWVLETSAEGSELVRVVKGAASQRHAVAMKKGATGPWLQGDQLLFVDDGVLFAQALGEEPGAPVRVGEVGPVRVAPQPCRAGAQQVFSFSGAMALWEGGEWRGTARVSGADRAGPAISAAAAPAPRPALDDAAGFGMAGLLKDGAPELNDSPWGRAPDAPRGMFTPPAEKTAAARKPQRRPHLPRRVLGCDGAAGTLVWREPGREADVIRRRRCTAEGCVEEQVELAGLGVKAWWTAASLGERTVLVWRGDDGLVRLRSAPWSELVRAADVLLFDAPEHGGPEADDLEVFAGRSWVVALFRDRDGYRGVRIASDGTVASLE